MSTRTPLLRSIVLALAILLPAAPSVQAAAPSPMTRVELVRMIVRMVYTEDSINDCLKELSRSDYRLLFSDVSVVHPAAPELCMAMRTDIIEGYGDGSFRPDNIVNFVEAAKIISRALALPPAAGQPQPHPWYLLYVRALADRGAIPMYVSHLDQSMNEIDIAEILDRIENGPGTRPTRSLTELMRTTKR